MSSSLTSNSAPFTCLIVGAGPAGLIAADILSAAGERVLLVDRRSQAAWKLLVAGSSGLNVSFAGPEDGAAYRARGAEVARCLAQFTREHWLAKLRELGEETFLGTSRRYFIRSPKAANLRQRWMEKLLGQGVEFRGEKQLRDFSLVGKSVRCEFLDGEVITTPCALFALGSPSWETEAPTWPAAFRAHGLAVPDFEPANAGYKLLASPEFFARAEGKPIKGLVLHTKKGSKEGELMITSYGLEGTPVYSVGCPGLASADLKPGLAEERLAERLRSARGTLRQKLGAVKLSEGAELLAAAFLPAHAWENEAALAAGLKKLPLPLGDPRPLTECISAAGGLSWDELSPSLELKKFPGIFCAGEMVDWDAPTGGYLLQASVSMGAVAANGMLAKSAALDK